MFPINLAQQANKHLTVNLTVFSLSLPDLKGSLIRPEKVGLAEEFLIAPVMRQLIKY
jgi:hypothetical protein